MDEDNEPYIVTSSEQMKTDAVQRMAVTQLNRQNMEVYAAWRAGYDYLYVKHEIDAETFVAEYKCIPSDDPDLLETLFPITRYDISSSDFDTFSEDYVVKGGEVRYADT